MSAAKPKQPGLPQGPIQPSDLAIACYLYETMTDYAASLDRFRSKLDAALDLSQEDHRLALLKFLNDWGCRTLATKWHGKASEELDDWYGDARGLLRLPDGSPADLYLTRLDDLAKVFDSLSRRTASKRTRNGRRIRVSFGPTATSKTLFALLPATLPAWDRPMRKAFGYAGDGRSYAKFVQDVHHKIEETKQHCGSRGFDLESLPAKPGRPPYTTAVQLTVEYYWITVTREVELPSPSTLATWLSWCDRA